MNSSIEKFYQYTAKTLSLEKSKIQLVKEASLSIALVFPNHYEVAMANLGFQSLYRLLNSYTNVRCERAFVYKSFSGINLTLETRQQLTRFDIIAFSISFELDYLNIVKILNNIGLNPLARDRHSLDPLIIAGGVATFINPEPIAPFIDLFILGEIEPISDTFVEHLVYVKQDKLHTIKQLAKLNGIYAPQFHDPLKKKIRIISNTKEVSPQFSAVITSQSHFQNMFLIEVGRGCGRHCRFCAASHVYHPVRFFNNEKLLKTIEENIFGTNKIGLVGAALCDYPKITELCRNLVKKNYQLGLSSFRFETITRSFLDVIHQAGIKTITLAPEAGTIRLRTIINKPIGHDHIMTSIELIAGSEIVTLKLYFMIGLPFEEEGDLLGMIDLIKEIWNIFIFNSNRKRELIISVNAFIPKPFTPFQWCSMDDEKSLRQKRHLIENKLRKLTGIKFTRKNVQEELTQAALALGGQQAATDLLSTISSSASIVTSSKIKIFQKSSTDPLPWDFIEYPVKKERLWREWQRSKELALS